MLEENIKELLNIIKDKVLKGDYNIIEIRSYGTVVEIEGGYKFQLWSRSKYPEDNFGIYLNSVFDYSFLKTVEDNTMETFENQAFRLEAYKIYKEKESNYENVQGIRKRKKEINRLKKELQDLEKLEETKEN
jgi:hypothetical protein